MHDFWQFLGTLVIGAPAIIFAFKAWKSSERTHGAVNGRIDEYKRLMKENADLVRQVESMRVNNTLPSERKDDATVTPRNPGPT